MDNMDLARHFSQIIASELSSDGRKIQPQQVLNTIQLLDDGATIPFIARYRKEITGSLNDQELRVLGERLIYLRELEDRRNTIIRSIEEQGKMDTALRQKIDAATTKQTLEDIYLPFKPKRRTKAQIAIEAGLLPLADALLEDRSLIPLLAAERFINVEAGFTDAKTTLDGARDILAERFFETPDLLGILRHQLWESGELITQELDVSKDTDQKFRDYYSYAEPIKKVPPHRALAVFRARKEGIISCKVDWPETDSITTIHPAIKLLTDHFNIPANSTAANDWLHTVCRWSWRVKIHPHIEMDLLNKVRENAEEHAIDVFAKNLKELLLAPPAGAHTVMGLDPGIRTGVKVAIVDTTGQVVDSTTVYPFPPANKLQESITILTQLCKKHNVTLISIGNGTASRETEKMVQMIIQNAQNPLLKKIVVSEAGASVYSASPLAAAELPHLDVTLRGAASIARRVQDPLAELVKIEPKAIGVGQYQHDVNQRKLSKALDGVVENCVNHVGVDLNTASAALLSHISGLNNTLAEQIVEFRNTHGRFSDRNSLLKVPRLGPKAYEQAAGFLRIHKGSNPLDASSVHPEAYPLVEKIASEIKMPIEALIGNREAIAKIKPAQFVSEQFGLPTIQDILRELEKPGRDPRAEFRTVEFNEEITDIKDLKTGQILDGVVTNVTAFGAFVDIGVHQDGLVHISALADRYVEDAHTVVKPGQIVKVRVLEVDIPRKRIGLTMRLNAPDTQSTYKKNSGINPGSLRKRSGSKQAVPTTHPQTTTLGGALAEALSKLKS